MMDNQFGKSQKKKSCFFGAIKILLDRQGTFTYNKRSIHKISPNNYKLRFI